MHSCTGNHTDKLKLEVLFIKKMTLKVAILEIHLSLSLF